MSRESITIDILRKPSKSISKHAIFMDVPPCVVRFEDGRTSMAFNMCMVAEYHQKRVRRKIAALVIGKCEDEEIRFFASWLREFFPKEIQEELFGLSVNENGGITPDKMLERSINKYRKRYTS